MQQQRAPSYQMQNPMGNQNKFTNQHQLQLQQQQQQQQMKMLAQAQAAGLTMDEIYGDEMDEYYDEEFEGQVDPQQLAYYQQQQQYAQQYASGGYADSSSGGDALIAEGFEILEEELDEDYDPTAAEIEEYARYLGMDMQNDKNLFYIAKEGLKAPLPGPWKPCKSPGGQIYYYNFQSKELQKDHPCDDYYRKYYIQEKNIVAKKKEESVIKKHIKQQQKVAQQQAEIQGSSVGSAASYQLMNQLGGKSATGQSAILQQMMSPLDVSASAVDEIVNQKLDQIVTELEDQQIAYERKRREELKVLEQNKNAEIQRIKADAEEEMEYLKEKIKHEVQIKTESKKKGVDETKKRQLQDQMKKRIKEAKANEDERKESERQEIDVKLKKDSEKLKQSEQKQLEKTVQSIKTSFQEQMVTEKDQIKAEISRMANDTSGDIEVQIEKMRTEIMGPKLRAELRLLEDELDRKLDEAKRDQQRELDDKKRTFRRDFDVKLQKEKQQLQQKMTGSGSLGSNMSLADQKLQLKQDQDDQVREKKRQLERETKEKIRLSRQNYEQDLDKAKQQLKLRLQSEQDRETEQIEQQLQDIAMKSQTRAQEQEDRLRYILDSKKDEIQYQMQQEWDQQKQSNLSQDQAEGIQAVKQTISQARNKVYQQESKNRELERNLTNQQDEVIRLKADLRTKQRNLEDVSRATTQLQEQEVTQMETEMRLKDDELTRIQRKIKERREALARGDAVKYTETTRSDQLLQKATDIKLRYMQQEVDALKLQLKEIALREKEFPSSVNRPHRFRSTKFSIPEIIDYSVAEMTTQIAFDLPVNQKMIEKLSSEMIVTKQLIANLDRNRIKWRKEIFDSDKISFDRKLALQSVKDKLDKQAINLQEELNELDLKHQKAKRQEQQLIQLREKLQQSEKERDQDLARGHLKEAQIEFDRYLRTYQNQHKISSKKQHQEEISDFRSRWAHYVTDELPETQDLRPMLGLDAYEAVPKPFRIFSHYDSHASWGQKSKILIDHEIGKINRNRTMMRTFLNQQQTFLSNLKIASA